jgi:hypothetical protein
MRMVMPQAGCGYFLIYSLIFQASNLAAFPVSMVSVACVMLLGWPGLVVAVGWSALAVGLVYRYTLPHAAGLLERREPQLLAALAKGAE